MLAPEGEQPGRLSHLRMVLSRVERASLWKVMMMLVGERSLQYTSRAHLGKERQETSQTFKGKGDLKSYNQGHCSGHQHGQMPGVQWGQPRRTALGKTPGPHPAEKD